MDLLAEPLNLQDPTYLEKFPEISGKKMKICWGGMKTVKFFDKDRLETENKKMTREFRKANTIIGNIGDDLLVFGKNGLVCACDGQLKTTTIASDFRTFLGMMSSGM